ncbi:Esa1p-associated factor [Diatrype stigma]|uniref:Chromatin modification-related protein EAF3 n=1 Tax=Diatrype stigma TaxID=117547 RepID=A0AAN9UUZ0_9PEZI
MAATRTSRKPATAAPKQPSRVTKNAAPKASKKSSPKTAGEKPAPKAAVKTPSPKTAGKRPQKAGLAATAASSRPRRSARVTRASRASLPKEAFQVGVGPVDLSDEGIEKRRALFTQWEAQYAVDGEAAYPYLTATPSTTHRYLNKANNFVPKDDRFVAPKVYSPPEHPKITEAEKKGTLTRTKLLYYAGMNRITREDAFHARPSVKLKIPDGLKAILVDDWENVTKNNQLIPLPHPKPVSKILEDYTAYEAPKRPEGSAQVDILHETLAGLKEYFDKALGRILLYRFERAQYSEVVAKWNSSDPEWEGKKTASDTYGAEHLMRLVVSLPELVAQTNMDQQSVNRLREEMTKITNWLAKNAEQYFLSEYEVPNSEYIDKAKN